MIKKIKEHLALKKNPLNNLQRVYLEESIKQQILTAQIEGKNVAKWVGPSNEFWDDYLSINPVHENTIDKEVRAILKKLGFKYDGIFTCLYDVYWTQEVTK